jgi:adenylate cyclase
MALDPKLKRNVTRIIPFGFIWAFFFGSQIVDDLTSNPNPESLGQGDIPLTPSVALFALFASFLSGFIVGSFEVLVFEKRFRRFSFASTIFIKLSIYLSVFLFIILVFYPIAFSIESSQSIFSEETLNGLLAFIGTLPFWNTLIQLGFALFLCVVYSSISENLGYNYLRNVFFGVYHKPMVEQRIFMFLDMKDSTMIAEALGHEKYFELLSDYYEAMSDAIINHKGEVYQYIGDEVVVTWKASEGLKDANCIQTFFAIQEQLNRESDHFLNAFGIVPGFKAGIHIGEVTTGEMGALKREIVFTGDVLNTAARLQGLCKKYDQDFIASHELLDRLKDHDMFEGIPLGDQALRGKTLTTSVFGIQKREQAEI